MEIPLKVGSAITYGKYVTLQVTGFSIDVFLTAAYVYQCVDGSWHIRFKVVGQHVIVTTLTIGILGVVFKNRNNSYANEAAVVAAGSSGGSCIVVNNTNQVRGYSSLGENFWAFSGDVELDSKPTFI